MKIVSLGKIINYLYKLYITKDPHIISHYKWVKDNAEHLLTEYDLTSNSIVLDLGGYKGDWTEKIYNKYNCNIFIFEPVSLFHNKIKKRFDKKEKIHVFNFGLSNSTCESKIFLNKDGSSIYKIKNSSYEIIKLKDIIETIKDLDIKSIDLLKINIEGGEYAVLPRLINSNYVKICRNIQIQFHKFIENAVNLRIKIQEDLSKTHHLTYYYPWVWENWEINP